MQRKFLIPFIKYAKRGDLIHCTPDTTQKQSAWAERNFSGDSPWVIYDNSSSQTQGPIWLGYHFYCPVSRRSIKQVLVSCLCFKSFVSVEETCCMQSPSLVSLIIYNQLFPQWTKMQSRIMKKRKVFSAIFICHNDIVHRSWRIKPINLICWSPSGWRGCLPTPASDCTGPSSPEQKYF